MDELRNLLAKAAELLDALDAAHAPCLDEDGYVREDKYQAFDEILGDYETDALDHLRGIVAAYKLAMPEAVGSVQPEADEADEAEDGFIPSNCDDCGERTYNCSCEEI